ncbi:MAG: polynucleotide kinase-phosphatase [Raineya sp.]|jgi:polynucleotide kinase-phosphatase|nr:polynucleotide kinase-phosphatase [Raineya sp.]
MHIKVPELSLVVLIGVSGSGKSSFAKKHFKRTEIISSDECRALISDDENNQAVTPDAFELLHFMAGKRLKNGLLTVVDATSVQRESRKTLIDLARNHHVLPIAVILDLPEAVCIERNKKRSDRTFGHHVIRNQAQQLKKNIRNIKEEGFSHVYHLKSLEDIENVEGFIREKLYNDKKHETSPLDIIGDVHGCFEELTELLAELGYKIEKVEENETNFGFAVTPPENRKAVFVGDLTDRGPDSPSVLKLVMSMVQAGTAYCVCGNHDSKLQKHLSGKKVQLKHGLETTVEQLEKETDEFKQKLEKFLYKLVSHYVFDEGRLVVAHAGIREEMQGRGSGAIRAFCMYGETTGEIDEFGLPVRYNWAKDYKGKAKVVYGHTPVPEAEWLNRTIDIDTGCVFGGKLTALRYPEDQLVSVKAKKEYYTPRKPFLIEENALNAQQEYDDVLDVEEVIGKRIIQTRLRSNITIREENAIAALEVMSRFAVNPKWLIYLPPTMSPCATSSLPEYLEYPTEALDYYQKRDVQKVICEEKHMGSRAVIVLCKDEEAALKRFGVENEGIGVCYTRSGRNFFNDEVLEKAFLNRVKECLDKADFWKKFQTEWVCFDTELMPWSAKAQALLKEQYAAVGAAASAALPEAEKALALTLARGIEGVEKFYEKIKAKNNAVQHYIKAYQQYCWEVNSIDDYKLAPFHILATEGKVHIDKTHEWHMQQIAEICKNDPTFMVETPYKIVDFHDDASYDEAVAWWLELTAKGGEGMVVKPYDFIAYQKADFLQPAIKCRGKEYLRIIYGAEYDLPENLKRLKNRALNAKQSLALREFALSIESLERFVRKEPLRKTHESVFGLLALESEDIDPRL